MDPIPVLLVDDNPIFLNIVTRFLQSHKDVVVVGSAGGGEAALACAPDLKPQVILLDLAMPGLSGLEVIPRLRVILPTVAIIVLSWRDAEGYRPVVLAAGADGFVSKATLSTDLLLAIRRVTRTSQSQ